MAKTGPRKRASENNNSQSCNSFKIVWQRVKARYDKTIAPFLPIEGVTLATFVLAYIAWNTDRTLHDTLVAANRAWLAPKEAHISDLQMKIPFRFSINVENVGKEPAIDFVAQQEFGSFPHPGANSWYKTFTPSLLHDICRVTHSNKTGGPIYPAEQRHYVVQVDSFPISQEILDGKQVLFVEGCFAYRTFGIERKSAYCYMLVPDGPIQTWTFGRCPYGNKAT